MRSNFMKFYYLLATLINFLRGEKPFLGESCYISETKDRRKLKFGEVSL